jgi:hypothetical protein
MLSRTTSAVSFPVLVESEEIPTDYTVSRCSPKPNVTGCEGKTLKHDSWCNGDCLAALRFGGNGVLTKDPSVKFMTRQWDCLNAYTESGALKTTDTEEGWADL